MSPERNTLRRAERLKSRKLIRRLFSEGASFRIHPIRLIWISLETWEQHPVQVAFAVPRARFPHAIDRNRVKRLMREAWRNQKAPLYRSLEERRRTIALILIWQDAQLPEYRAVSAKISLVLKRLTEEIGGKNYDEPKAGGG